jgi:hypothetical protein
VKLNYTATNFKTLEKLPAFHLYYHHSQRHCSHGFCFASDGE